MRLLGMLLAVAAIGGVSYFMLRGDPARGTASAPKQTLDHVRVQTSQFEKDAQEHADEVMKKTQSE